MSAGQSGHGVPVDVTVNDPAPIDPATLATLTRYSLPHAAVKVTRALDGFAVQSSLSSLQTIAVDDPSHGNG